MAGTAGTAGTGAVPGTWGTGGMGGMPRTPGTGCKPWIPGTRVSGTDCMGMTAGCGGGCKAADVCVSGTGATGGIDTICAGVPTGAAEGTGGTGTDVGADSGSGAG